MLKYKLIKKLINLKIDYNLEINNGNVVYK